MTMTFHFFPTSEPLGRDAQRTRARLDELKVVDEKILPVGVMIQDLRYKDIETARA